MPIGIAKLETNCPKCGNLIKQGQMITWGKSTKSSHVNCNNPDVSLGTIDGPDLANATITATETLTSIATELSIDELESLLAKAKVEAKAKAEKERVKRLRMSGISQTCIDNGFNADDAQMVLDHIVDCDVCQPKVKETIDAVTVVIDREPISEIVGAVDTSTVSEYFAQNGEVKNVTAAVNAGLNVALKGPAGCGKTHLVYYLANLMNAVLFEIVGDGGVQREDVIGARGYNGKETYWLDGTATRALRCAKDHLVILYVDEPNRLREDIQAALFPIMDHRRRVVLPENNGEVVQASAPFNGSNGLVTISSWNDGYRGTNAMDEAYNDRYEVGLTLDYLPADKELELLQARTNVKKADAEMIIGISETLRQAHKDKQIQTPISTRALLAYARLVSVGFNSRLAGELTLVEKVASTNDLERKIIRDVVHANTDGKVQA